jgi:hypothetical protein
MARCTVPVVRDSKRVEEDQKDPDVDGEWTWLAAAFVRYRCERAHSNSRSSTKRARILSTMDTGIAKDDGCVTIHLTVRGRRLRDGFEPEIPEEGISR